MTMTNIKTYLNAFNAAIEIQNDQFDYIENKIITV